MRLNKNHVKRLTRERILDELSRITRKQRRRQREVFERRIWAGRFDDCNLSPLPRWQYLEERLFRFSPIYAEIVREYKVNMAKAIKRTE